MREVSGIYQGSAPSHRPLSHTLHVGPEGRNGACCAVHCQSTHQHKAAVVDTALVAVHRRLSCANVVP